jgi:hypothetical protein
LFGSKANTDFLHQDSPACRGTPFWHFGSYGLPAGSLGTLIDVPGDAHKDKKRAHYHNPEPNIIHRFSLEFLFAVSSQAMERYFITFQPGAADQH